MQQISIAYTSIGFSNQIHIERLGIEKFTEAKQKVTQDLHKEGRAIVEKNCAAIEINREKLRKVAAF